MNVPVHGSADLHGEPRVNRKPKPYALQGQFPTSVKKLFFIFLALASLPIASAVPVVSARFPRKTINLTVVSPTAFDAENSRTAWTGSESASTIAVASAIAQNKRVVVVIAWDSASQTLTSVADSVGNTYAIQATRNSGSDTTHYAIASANASTALTSSDTISINWGSPAYTYRAAWVGTITGTNVTNATALDATASAGTYGTAISISASTAATATALVGLVDGSTGSTYTGSAWTALSQLSWGGAPNGLVIFWKNATASGTQDPAGTIGLANWNGLWAAYRP